MDLWQVPVLVLARQCRSANLTPGQKAPGSLPMDLQMLSGLGPCSPDLLACPFLVPTQPTLWQGSCEFILLPHNAHIAHGLTPQLPGRSMTQCLIS